MSPLKGPRGKELLQGEALTLKASSAIGATAGTNGTGVFIGGERRRYIFLLTVSAAATDVTDTLDVYIDWSLDDSTYYNGGHFTQCTGTGGAKTYYAVFDATTGTTAGVDVTTDQAANTFKPTLFGPYVRARWVVVDPGAGAASFTFAVTGYAL